MRLFIFPSFSLNYTKDQQQWYSDLFNDHLSSTIKTQIKKVSKIQQNRNYAKLWINQTERVIPLFAKSSSLDFTFLLFILFNESVIFLNYPKSKTSSISNVLSVNWFWPRFRLVTLEQKQAFSNYFMTSSVILLRTSLRFLNRLLFSIYSQRARTLLSPS